MLLNLIKNKKLLISSSAGDTIKDSVKFAQELGLGLEISRIPMYKKPNVSVSDAVKILKSDLEGFTNRLTMHSMFHDVNISSADYEIMELSRKRFIQSFEVAKSLGADTLLFHTGFKGTKHTGSIYKFKKKFVEFWLEFIKEFEKAGIVAVVENVFESSPNFCLELYDKIASENFKLAIDTGHINIYAKETNVKDWLKFYGKKLHHMHIHNNSGFNDDHSNLLNGTLNFKEIFEAINNLDLHPSFVFEMESKDDVLKSLEFLKKI